MGYVALWMGASHTKSLLSLSRDFTQSRDQRIVWHYGWVFLIISYHSVKFSGHQPCVRGDILFLICHVTSCCHRVMWHYWWVPLNISLHSAKSGGHRHCARREILFFVCLVTSRDFVARESCDTMGEFPSLLVTTLQSLVIIDLL